MQVIEHEEAPDIKIAHSVVFEAMRKDVTGYKQSPLGATSSKASTLSERRHASRHARLVIARDGLRRRFRLFSAATAATFLRGRFPRR